MKPAAHIFFRILTLSFLMPLFLQACPSCPGSPGVNSVTDSTTDSSEAENQPESASIPVTIAKEGVETISPGSMYLLSFIVSSTASTDATTGTSAYLSANLSADSGTTLAVGGQVNAESGSEYDVAVIVDGVLTDVVRTENLLFEYDASDAVDAALVFAVYASDVTNYDEGPVGEPLYTTIYYDVLRAEYALAVNLTSYSAEIPDQSLALSFEDVVGFVSESSSSEIFFNTVSVFDLAATEVVALEEALAQTKYDVNGNLYGIGSESQKLYQISSDGSVTVVTSSENLPDDRRFALHPSGRYLVSTVQDTNPQSGELSTTLCLHDLEDISKYTVVPFLSDETATVDHISLDWSTNSDVALIKRSEDGAYTLLEYNLSELIEGKSSALPTENFSYSSSVYLGDLVSDGGYNHEIAFECQNDTGYTNLCRVDFSAGTVERIVQGDFTLAHPVFSSDALYLLMDLNVQSENQEVDEVTLYAYNSEQLSYVVSGTRAISGSTDSSLVAYLSDQVTGSNQIGLAKLDEDIQDQLGDVNTLSLMPQTFGMTVGASLSVTASGGTLPYTFSVVSGSGTINAATGLVTAPNAEENMIIQVTDAAGDTSTATVGVYAFASDEDGFAGFRIGTNPLNAATDFAIDDNGKYVSVGATYNNTNSDFAIIRTDASGIFDNTFGDSGFVVLDVDSVENVLQSVALQSDQKILVCGFVNYGSGDHDAFLARYNSNGTLDTGFGEQGTVQIQMGGSSDSSCAKLAALPTGKILVGGYVHNGQNKDFALMRFNSDGSVDATFGVSGLSQIDFNSEHDEIIDLEILATGKILVAGYATTISPTGKREDFALVRLNFNGLIDLGFGTTGKVTTNVGGASNNNSLSDILVYSNGQILAVGESHDGTFQNIAVVRYLPNGNLDALFDADGIVISVVGSDNALASSVLLQDDQKILVAGSAVLGSTNSIVQRYLSDGAIDTSFGDSGLMQIDMADYDAITDLELQDDGRVIFVGFGGEYDGTMLTDSLIYVGRFWP